MYKSGLSEVAEINDKNGVKDIPLETKVGGLQSEEKGEPLSPLKDPWKDSVIATIRAEPLLHEQILCLQSVRLKVVEDVLQANGVSTTGRCRLHISIKRTQPRANEQYCLLFQCSYLT